MIKDIIYQSLTPVDFNPVILLATQVHGEGYLDEDKIQTWYKRGIKNNINASFVAYHQQQLVGFRITYAPSQWSIDQWCSPRAWQIERNKVCYFKCNTVDENYRGNGIGSKLLTLSIKASKKQGALAGVSHLWKQSPGNSAVNYFRKCGGQDIKSHPDKWRELSKTGYICPICQLDCRCEAAEMMITFKE